MGTTTVRAPTRSVQPIRAIAERGGTGAGIAVIVNTLLLVVGQRFVDIPVGFDPLSIGSVVTASAAGAVAATVVYVILDRLVTETDKLMTGIASFVLILSVVPVFVVAPTLAEGVGPGVLVLLVLMHAVVAVASVGALTHGEVFERYRETPDQERPDQERPDQERT
ncbi:DUF6069 family protein [Haloarchaeobius sp. DT45]|uniref:DUF6069 family protein n=1 Tax=Haloarchaeobius sp. DT45 TaxID=3446116 RepID=UPI003F6CB961